MDEETAKLVLIRAKHDYQGARSLLEQALKGLDEQVERGTMSSAMLPGHEFLQVAFAAELAAIRYIALKEQWGSKSTQEGDSAPS